MTGSSLALTSWMMPKMPDLDVDGPGLAADGPEIRDVVADDRLAGEHGRRGLAAGAREGAREVRHAALGPVDADDEHVLGQPAFAVGLADGQAQGQFLQAHRVAAVLRVDAVDHVLGDIDVDAFLVGLGRHVVLQPPRRVQEPEEPLPRARRLNCS